MSRLLILTAAAIVLMVTITDLVSSEVIGLDESNHFCNEKSKLFDLIQRICGPSYEVVNVDKSIQKSADTEYNQLVYEECCEKDCSTTFIKSVACPIEYLESATYSHRATTKTPWRIRCPTPLFSPYVVFSPVLNFLFSDCFYVADPEIDSIRNQFTMAVEA